MSLTVESSVKQVSPAGTSAGAVKTEEDCPEIPSTIDQDYRKPGYLVPEERCRF